MDPVTTTIVTAIAAGVAGGVAEASTVEAYNALMGRRQLGSMRAPVPT